MDLRLTLRSIVNSVVLLTVVSCQLPFAEDGLVMDFDLREYEYSTSEDVDLHRAGNPQRSALRLLARERLYVTPHRLRVEATSEALVDVPDGERQRVRSVIDFDWLQGVVWSATIGDAPVRQLLTELDYEGENLYRRNRIDFVTRYVESPEVRRLPDIELFLGDGRTEGVDWRAFGGRRVRVARIAALPGSFWEVWLLPLAESPFDSIEQVSAYLAGAMGVAPSRARLVAERLDGVPVRITVHVFSGVDSFVLVEGFLRDVSWQTDLPTASPLPELEDDLVSQLENTASLLAWVRQPDQLSTALTPTTVFLKLSELLTQAELDAAIEVFLELNNAYAQIELVRALLRSPRIDSWGRLRAILHGPRGDLAMHVVEALVAEADTKALSALFHVLERRDEFSDVAPEALITWGISHVRVLSGMSLAELVKYSTSGTDPDVSADRRRPARAAELDRWLRWWEKKQGSLPRL